VTGNGTGPKQPASRVSDGDDRRHTPPTESRPRRLHAHSRRSAHPAVLPGTKDTQIVPNASDQNSAHSDSKTTSIRAV